MFIAVSGIDCTIQQLLYVSDFTNVYKCNITNSPAVHNYNHLQGPYLFTYFILINIDTTFIDVLSTEMACYTAFKIHV